MYHTTGLTCKRRIAKRISFNLLHVIADYFVCAAALFCLFGGISVWAFAADPDNVITAPKSPVPESAAPESRSASVPGKPQAASEAKDTVSPPASGLYNIFVVPDELTQEGRDKLFDLLTQINPDPAAPIPAQFAPAPGNATEWSCSIVSRLIRPSLVHIETISPKKKPGLEPAGYTMELNNESGSGFIVFLDSKFYVITNAHVIRAMGNGSPGGGVSLYLYDGSRISPKQIWRDRASDIAVMEIEGLYWPVRWGNDSFVRPGNHILAYGSPFGLKNSCSSGIVSAVGRRNLEVGRTDKGLQNYIQTDAAIHPGNSGGPLVNLRGEVVGMNSAIASNSGFGEGVSFAIPNRMIQWVVRQIIATGTVQRGYIGASYERNYSIKLAVQMGLFDALGMKNLPVLPPHPGAMIANVIPNSPAAKATLRPGDIIIYYDDCLIEDLDHLQYLVNTTPVNKKVTIAFYRAGKLYEHAIVVLPAPGV